MHVLHNFWSLTSTQKLSAWADISYCQPCHLILAQLPVQTSFIHFYFLVPKLCNFVQYPRHCHLLIFSGCFVIGVILAQKRHIFVIKNLLKELKFTWSRTVAFRQEKPREVVLRELGKCHFRLSNFRIQNFGSNIFCCPHRCSKCRRRWL